MTGGKNTMNTKNRIKAFLTAAVMAAAPLAMNIPSASAEDYIVENGQVLTLFGDVNFDGSVGISDAVQLKRYLLGQIDELGNVKNADLLADGVIDAFDMVYLRKQLVGAKKPAGTKLGVKVVDMMTGETLENAEISLNEMNGNILYPIGDKISTYGEDINYYGLPDDKDYQYFITVEGLPEGYSESYKKWDHVVTLTVPAGTEEKDIVIRVCADNAVNNVKITQMDWCQGKEYVGYGNFNVTDTEGNYYYQRNYWGEMALPDGDYHADFNLFGESVAFIDQSGDFAEMIKGYYPDADIKDCSQGIDFSVVNGKPDRDLFIDLGPVDGMSNSINVNCFDSSTGLPLEGVELSLVEASDSYAKTVSWTSDGTTKVFDDLYRTGQYAYDIHVDKVPEGYTAVRTEDWAYFPYVRNFSTDINFYFSPVEGEKDLSFSVMTWPDKQPYTGDTTFSILNADKMDNMVLSGIKSGEKFALKDGDYLITANKYDDADPYCGISVWSELGEELAAEEPGLFDKVFRSDMAMFTVKNGKIEKDIVLYVGEKDKAMAQYEKDLISGEEEIPEEKEES